MELLEDIQTRKTSHSLLNTVNWSHLEFGKYHSDHMLVCDFLEKKWQEPQIIPFGELSLSPLALAFHYGQTIFEGMKAFRMKDGRISIFRPDKHYQRMVRTCERMCMPIIPEDLFHSGLYHLVALDREWVPDSPGSALYIRPFMIATESRLGVKVSDEYKFLIVSGPVAPLYQRPIRVKVETEFVRAAKGGTGYAKCGGNYGAAFYPTQLARQEGFDQVLWTDSQENRYVEELGTTNVMFVINGILVTPALSDTILDGVTRNSFLTLAREAGICVEERKVSVDEVLNGIRKNTLSEAFCVGTAAVCTSIGSIGIGNEIYELPESDTSGLAASLKANLEKIRHGETADRFGWNMLIS